jgi:hydroxyethylthiazole kinase-like uncharacterized protein yjeF
MQNEPIASIDLMERAAAACLHWLEQKGYLRKKIAVFCGKGNNGGDGLALARMLALQGSAVVVYILEFGHKGTEDFQLNLARLHQTEADIKFIQSTEQLPALESQEVVVDALLGSGLNRPIEGFTACVVQHINQSGNEIISIDIPSGLFVDQSSKGNLAVKARHTLSFQCQKPAFMVAENSENIGAVHILEIGLHPDYLKNIKPAYVWIKDSYIRRLYKKRNPFSHKGSFGHALLIAGSYGKIGAAVLCARACLRGGAGLVTCHLPRSGVDILQIAVPEAMVDPNTNEVFNEKMDVDLQKFSAVGIGPGIGTDAQTANFLEHIFLTNQKPMVVDADAINLVALHQLHHKIPKGSVITPHPKEFERLFGPSENDFLRIEKAKQQAQSLGLTIVLKGHRTFIAAPNGDGYFNSTGNPGMATGGTGDVLTGLITSLVCQGYDPTQAAVLGVYWHGAAGDLAASHISQESLIASDIIDHLGLVNFDC